MNFPTAYFLAKARHPIARAAWLSAAPKWLTNEDGAWFVNEADSRSLVTSEDAAAEITANLTELDLRAHDWQVPQGCVVAGVQLRADFPAVGGGRETAFAFDMLNPPCKVKLSSGGIASSPSSPSSPPADFALLAEDGSYLMSEGGMYFVLEH